jgi:hypothetical protein
MTATQRKEFRPDAHPPRLHEIRGNLTTLPEGWTLEIKVLTEDPVPRPHRACGEGRDVPLELPKDPGLRGSPLPAGLATGAVIFLGMVLAPNKSTGAKPRR